MATEIKINYFYYLRSAIIGGGSVLINELTELEKLVYGNNNLPLKQRVHGELIDDYFISDWIKKSKDLEKSVTEIYKDILPLEERQILISKYSRELGEKIFKLFLRRLFAIKTMGEQWEAYLAEERSKLWQGIEYSGEEWSQD